MSQEDVDVIVQMFERGQTDPESSLSVFDPDIEWDMSRLMPDGRIYYGHAGVREFWRDWAGTFEDFKFSIDNIVDADDGNVVVRIHQVGTGRGSGAPVSFYFGQVWTVNDGMIVRLRSFPSLAEALEAVGLAG